MGRAAAIGLAGALACMPAQAQSADESAGQRLTRILLTSDAPAELDDAARKLSALGSEAIEPMLQALVVDATERSVAQRGAALGVLRERGGEVERGVVALAQRGLAADATARALNLIAEVPTQRGLSSLVAVASTAQPDCIEEDSGDSCITSTLRRAMGRLLLNQPDSVRNLDAAMRDCPREFVSSLLEALADTPATQNLLALTDLLRVRAWDRVFLLDQIARGTHALPSPFDDCVRDAVRSELGDLDASVVREAAVCAGWLEDDDAVPALIERLADSSAGVRTNSLWALRHITGRPFAGDQIAWQRWHDAQSEWWSSQAPDLLADLGSDKAPERMAAINELMRHDFPRHELARQLAQALPAYDSAVLRLGCSALAALHSNAAAPSLRDLLSIADPHVADLVKATLDGLGTGTSRARSPAAAASESVLGSPAGRGLPRTGPRH